MKLCPTCQNCYDDHETECVQETHEALMPGRPGDRLIADKYRLDRLIARGGMGSVYSGTHVDLERSVAIKLFQPDHAADPAAFERFRREARVAAKIKHPNIADIYDYGSLTDGESYIVMELVEGQTLLDTIRQVGQLSFGEAIMLSRQVADGMEAAHHSGVIHRDLKPSNIVLTRNFDGSVMVKIIDFGIAKISEQLSPDDHTLTATGTLVGTPRYMSPEQCLGHELDARTDIYSFGVILYEMLAGQPPFDATSAIAIALKHVQESPPPLEQFRENVPTELNRLITDLLSTEPAGRPESATELKSRLAEIENSIGGYVEQGDSRLLPALIDSQAVDTDQYNTRVSVPVEKVTENSSDPYATEVIATEPLNRDEISPRPLFDVGITTIKRAVPLQTEVIAANAVSKNGLKISNQDFDETLIASKPRPRRSPLVLVGIAIAILVGIGILWVATRSETSTQSEPLTASPSGTSATKSARPSGVSSEGLEKADNELKAPEGAGVVSGEIGSDVDSEQARSEITSALNEWVAATNERDIDKQMTFYTPAVDVFYRTRNVPNSAVRAEKERLFDQADKIEVEVGEPQFEISEDGQRATTRFRKRYVIEGPQNNRRGEVLQELNWLKTANGWRITGERDVRVIRNAARESRRGGNILKNPHQLVLKGVKKLIQPFH